MTPKRVSLSMQQDARFDRHRKPTRRDVFLAEMDQVVPWSELCTVIEPPYPKEPSAVADARWVWSECFASTSCSSGTRFPIRRWKSAVRLGRDAPVRGHRSWPGRRAGRDDVMQVPAPAGEAGLADQLFAAVSEHLKRHGMKLSQGTIVDATIIAVAPSTKNKSKMRDPQMHSTKKGNPWYFGMKAHIGVDEATGQVHHVTSTAANVADVPNLLHGKKRHIFGDAGYLTRVQDAS
jgi:IS5 family transposase